MESEFEHCKNCKRDIAASNYVLHSAFCERNIQLCPKCTEPVPRREMEEHMENSHALEVCSLCSAVMEKWKLEKHKESCPKLPVGCSFCDLEFPRDDLDEHVAACGARTEKCSVCHQYVMLQQMDSHQRLCEKKSCPSPPLGCNFCELNLPVDSLEEHIAACGARTEKCLICHQYVMLRNLESHRKLCRKDDYLEQPISCKFCDFEFPKDCLDEHIETCGVQTEKCSVCHQFIMLRNMKSHQRTCKKEAPSTNFVKCRFCERDILLDMLDTHVSFCKPKAMRCHNCGETVTGYMSKHVCKKELNSLKVVICMLCDKRFPTTILAEHIADCHSRLFRDTPTPEFTTCEFCQEQYPSIIFDSHVSVCKSKTKRCPDCGAIVKRYLDKHFCEKGPSKLKGTCNICKEEVPLVDLNVHTSVCTLVSAKAQSSYGDLKDNMKIRAIQLSSPEQKDLVGSTSRNKSFDHPSPNVFQECKYCQEKMPPLIYSSHLEVCPQQPSKCKSCLKTVSFHKRRPEDHDCQTNLVSRSSVEKRGTSRSTYLEDTSELYKCVLCFETMPIDKRKRHEESECKMIFGDENDFPNVHHYKPIEHKNAYATASAVSKPPFRENLEKDSRDCHICGCKIPSDRFIEHVKLCSFQRKMCHFCKKVILIEEEDFHLSQCIDNYKNEGERESLDQHSIAKHGANKRSRGKKNKNNKGITGFINNLGNNIGNFLSVRDSSKASGGSCAIKEDLYDPGDGVPCEFCNEIFPFFQIIEHQSGCRPDLARFTGASEASGFTPYDAYRSMERKDQGKLHFSEREHSKHTSNTDSKTSKDSQDRSHVYRKPQFNSLEEKYPQKAEKEYTFSHAANGAKSDFILKKKQSEAQEVCKRKESPKILFSYKAGEKSEEDNKCFRDLVRGKGIDAQESLDSEFEAGEFLSINSTLSSQATCSSTLDETHTTKDYENGTSLKLLKPKWNELKAIGAERELRKGITQIDKNSVLSSSPKAYDEAIYVDQYAQNESVGVEKRSRSINSDNTTGSSEDVYMSCEEEDFEFAKSFGNEAVADNDRNIENTQSKSILLSEEGGRKNEITFSNNLKETLNTTSKYKSNLSEHVLMLDVEEDADLKNKETFGSDCEADLDHSKYDCASEYEDIERKNMSKLRTPWSLNNTDNVESFLRPGDFVLRDDSESKKDNDMEAYFQFLEKDDKVSDSNDDSSPNISRNAESCSCGNSVCYCSFYQQSTSSDDVTVVTLDDFVSKGARSKISNDLSSLSFGKKFRKEMDLKLESEQCVSSNMQRERSVLELQRNELNSSKEENENSANWTKWREQSQIHSDSD